MRHATQHSVREFTSFPGCNQIAVSHGMYMRKASRGKGHAHYEQKISLDKMRELGYGYALCTVDADNAAQIKVLRKAGWRDLDHFVSEQTGTDLLIFGIGV